LLLAEFRQSEKSGFFLNMEASRLPNVGQNTEHTKFNEIQGKQACAVKCFVTEFDQQYMYIYAVDKSLHSVTYMQTSMNTLGDLSTVPPLFIFKLWMTQNQNLSVFSLVDMCKMTPP